MGAAKVERNEQPWYKTSTSEQSTDQRGDQIAKGKRGSSYAGQGY